MKWLINRRKIDRDSEAIGETTRCVCGCGGKATRWTGHVKMGKDIVIAGWSESSHQLRVRSFKYGSFGDWRYEFGIEVGSYYDAKKGEMIV